MEDKKKGVLDKIFPKVVSNVTRSQARRWTLVGLTRVEGIKNIDSQFPFAFFR